MNAVVGDWWVLGSSGFWGASHVASPLCYGLLWHGRHPDLLDTSDLQRPQCLPPQRVGAPWGLCGAYLGPPPSGIPARSHQQRASLSTSAPLYRRACTHSAALQSLPACALEKESRYVFSHAHLLNAISFFSFPFSSCSLLETKDDSVPSPRTQKPKIQNPEHLLSRIQAPGMLLGVDTTTA